MARTHVEMYDDFINGRLGKDEWTHEAHLIACWMTLKGRTVDEAIEHLRESITAHNCGVGTANTEYSGYHHTITVYYVTAIAALNAATPEDLFNEETCNREAPLRHWDRDTLFSPKARLSYVDPTLARLPA